VQYLQHWLLLLLLLLKWYPTSPRSIAPHCNTAVLLRLLLLYGWLLL
jgi:hypothetical protein